MREQNLASGLEELFACDVVFVRPFGFFWRVLRNGEPVYVNSGCAVKTEREILKVEIEFIALRQQRIVFRNNARAL